MRRSRTRSSRSGHLGQDALDGNRPQTLASADLSTRSSWPGRFWPTFASIDGPSIDVRAEGFGTLADFAAFIEADRGRLDASEVSTAEARTTQEERRPYLPRPGPQARALAFDRTLRQFADPQLPELDRRPFGLEAEMARAGLAVVAAGDFLAVDPEPDLAIDRPDVVVVPLADALAQVLAGEAPLAVGRGGRKGVIFDFRRGRRRRWS